LTAKIDVSSLYPGPILILAGPGTGKTYTLAKRIKWLISKKIASPDEITVITFTNESAANMREQISNEKQDEVYVTPEKQPKRICTMHSLGHSIIASAPRKLGLKPGFGVLPEYLCEIIMKDASQVAGYCREDVPQTAICRRKGNCNPTEDSKCKICKEYQRILRRINFIDHDDQIMLACKLLNIEKILYQSFKAKTKHLLVDEYQDINKAQFDLIKLLSGGQEDGLYVVGDDDQSIYSWRGGTPDYILKFEKHFGPKTVIETLKECRRCPPNILNGALSVVIKNNPNRREKNGLHSNVKIENKIVIHNVPSDIREAIGISKITKQSIRSGNDVLILVPRYAFAGPIRDALRTNRINYECKFDVENTGLHLINEAMTWINNPKDNIALRLCLEFIVQNRKLRIPFDEGDTKEGTLKKISNLWNKIKNKNTYLYALLNESAKKEQDIKYVVSILEKMYSSSNSEPNKLLEIIVQYLRPWKSAGKLKAEISEWVDDGKTQNIGGNLAKILTMQGAKGLGKDVVIIVGLEEGVFPKFETHENELQEIRRLLYVSMTRAKKELHLFHARRRAGNIAYIKPSEGEYRSTLEQSHLLKLIPDSNKEEIYYQSY